MKKINYYDFTRREILGKEYGMKCVAIGNTLGTPNTQKCQSMKQRKVKMKVPV